MFLDYCMNEGSIRSLTDAWLSGYEGMGQNWIQNLWSQDRRGLQGQPIALQLVVPGMSCSFLSFSFSNLSRKINFPVVMTHI